MNNDFKLLSLSSLSSKYLSEIDEIRAKIDKEFNNFQSSDDNFISRFDKLIEQLSIARLKYDSISIYYYPANNNIIKDFHSGNNINTINNTSNNDLIDMNTSNKNNN